MRWRPLTWLLLSLLFFVAAVYFWRLGDEWALKRKAAGTQSATNQPTPHAAEPGAATNPFPLLSSSSGPLNLSPNPNLNLNPNRTNQNLRTAFRLSNTTKTVGELSRQESAILLENALFDT